VDPRTLKKWLIAIGVLYLVFPRDLVFDFLGRGLGLIDDLLVIALLVWFYRRHLRGMAARETRESEGPGRKERSSRAQPAASEPAFDPYEVLGIPSSASGETIQSAYKARMNEYHPDKVAHLGEELQELAHRKALEIQQAYQQLRK
jgi:DnaJ-domain-containing protein 1